MNLQYIFRFNDVNVGDEVCLSGMICDVFKDKTTVGLLIADLKGAKCVIKFDKDEWNNYREQCNKPEIKGLRVVVTGHYFLNRQNKPAVHELKMFKFLHSVNDILDTKKATNFENGLDNDTLRQIYAASIKTQVTDFLTKKGFINLSSRVITSSWSDYESVDLLEVRFPGFGSFAKLCPSPLPQMNECMSAAALDKVFVCTPSFISNFRFDGAGCEMDTIFVKSVGIKGEFSRISDLLQTIFEKGLKANLPNIEHIQLDDYNNANFDNTIGADLLIKDYTNADISNVVWDTIIDRVVYIVNKGSDLLIEYYEETSNQTDLIISNFVIYLDQFINCVSNKSIKSTHIKEASADER